MPLQTSIAEKPPDLHVPSRLRLVEWKAQYFDRSFHFRLHPAYPPYLNLRLPPARRVTEKCSHCDCPGIVRMSGVRDQADRVRVGSRAARHERKPNE
jgi:hypothetical protein